MEEEEAGDPGRRDNPAGRHRRGRGEENLTGRWQGRLAGAAATVKILSLTLNTLTNLITLNILTSPLKQPRKTNTGGMSTRSLNHPPGGNNRGTVVTSDRPTLQPGSGERRGDGRDPATAAPPPPPPPPTP